MQKVWLAYANTEKFDAINCFRNLGYSFWKMGNRHFSIGDIIYFYVSSESRVMFKTQVVEINMHQPTWDDDEYWSEAERVKAVGKRRMRLELMNEYNGDELDDERLRLYGMPERKSPLEQPVYKKYTDCIEYISRTFNGQ
jgi:hypothetical protein